MLHFFPEPQEQGMWWMNKLSSWISPYEVNTEFRGGNIWQHAVNKGVNFGPTPEIGLRVESKDAPVLAWADRSHLPSPFIKSTIGLPEGSVTGFGYNLWN